MRGNMLSWLKRNRPRAGRAGRVPMFSATKEVPGLGRGALRWCWQFYVYRLTRAGQWFFWPTLGFAICTSMSLQHQSYVVFCYVAGLWLVALALALLLKPRVRFEARHAGRACAGETLPVEITVEPLGRRRQPELSGAGFSVTHRSLSRVHSLTQRRFER